MNRKFLIIIFFTFAGCAYNPLDPVEPIIGNLDDSEKIEVKYLSLGCFHQYECLFVFKGQEVTVFDVQSGSVRSDGSIRLEPERKKLGSLKLSKADIEGLDRLFAFYASKPRGGCTTSDYIKVKTFSNDVLTATKEYNDESCETYELDGVLTLGELKTRLDK